MPAMAMAGEPGAELDESDDGVAGAPNAGPESGLSVTARRISEQMEANRISAHALAVRAGLGKGVVGAIVSGQTRAVRAGTLAKIAAALGVSASYLAGDTGAPDEPTGAEPWTAEAETCPVAGAAVKAALASRPGLRAYVAMGGGDALGIPAGARVVVDTAAAEADGRVGAVQIPGKGVAIRYRAKPYWVAVNYCRGVTDLDGAGVRALGAVVAIILPVEK